MAKRNAYHGAHFAQPESGNQPTQRPRRSKAPLVIIIVLLVLGGLGAGAWYFWQHRPLNATVNGEQRTVFKNSTIDDVFQSEKPEVTPGNYVSVGGNVLEEGKGDPYSVTVNGTTLTTAEASERKIVGNEIIVFDNGADVMEEHTSEVVDEQPKLEYRVANGVGDKGDYVQQGQIQYVAQWGRPGRREILHGTQTGETAEGAVEQETQNLIIMAQDIHPDNDQKLVALTFDDGPSYFTDDYLQILDEKGVKATFCIIGEQVSDGATIIAQTAEAGHQIACHSWSHLQLTTLDAEGVQQQIGDTTAALKDVIGKDVMYTRPPYGDIDTETWLKTGGLMSVSIYWTQDSLDWTTPGVDNIVSDATMGMRPGSIILMHDGGGDRSQTQEALPKVIDAWQEAGYTFVTVEELLKSDSSIDLSAVGDGGPMPEDAVWPTEIA